MNPKRLAIGGAVLVYLGLGLLLAQYLAGIAYFLAGKTMPHNVGIHTWALYWQWYSDDPVQRKHLQVSAAIAGFLVFVFPALGISSLLSKKRSLHGDARFARGSEVHKAGLYANDGIIVGKMNGRYLMYSGQQFVLLAAPTRSGKGVAVVVPNLLNYPGSVVVLDIKKENFHLTSGFRAKHGQKVFLFNPFAEDGRTHRWNPLDGIKRDRNARVGDVQAIAQALYPSEPSVREAFWSEQARNLFLGLALYLLDTPELPCTIGELLRQSSGKGQPVKTYLQDIMTARSKSDKPLCDECLDALGRFCATSENTLASILATFNAPLTIFANPIVDAATSASDFNIAMVRRQRMSIYIGIEPNRLLDASLLVNLFFSQLINLNTVVLPENDPQLKYQCLVVLDEFTAIGKVGIIAKAVAYIAGYNLRLLTVIQSISQLESVYGEKDTRNFVTNHALQILYPPREQKDANEYSDMLGYMTQRAVSTSVSRPRVWGSNTGQTSENLSDQRRALLLPQEIKELGQDSEIIIVENTKPILATKARYFRDHVFINRLKGVSRTLAALGRKLPNKEQIVDAAFVHHELAAFAPTLDIDLHKAKVERRTRPVEAGETIDLARLAVDVSTLPALADPAEPSKEEVAGIVDAFLSQLDWVDEVAGGSATRAPTNGPGRPSEVSSGEGSNPRDAALLEANAIEDASPEPVSSARQKVAAPFGSAPIDLAVLDL
jgi:type IV secretion system protein VirD4